MPALALTTFRFDAETCIAQAQPKYPDRVTLQSPATDVMTDLAIIKAETIDPKTRLQAAEQVMINRGVRSLFVTAKLPCIEGLITASDIYGEKPLKLVSAGRFKHQDICVQDVMTNLPELDVVDYGAVKAASVASLVATFGQLKCSHIVVVQAANAAGMARIRGVISLTQLERQLGQTLLAST